MARKTSYDEDKAKQVRNKALDDITEVLNESARSKKFGKFKQAMLLKLANTVLPRVSEISGPNGKPIPLYDYTIRHNNGHGKNKESEETD